MKTRGRVFPGGRGKYHSAICDIILFRTLNSNHKLKFLYHIAVFIFWTFDLEQLFLFFTHIFK